MQSGISCNPLGSYYAGSAREPLSGAHWISVAVELSGLGCITFDVTIRLIVAYFIKNFETFQTSWRLTHHRPISLMRLSLGRLLSQTSVEVDM